MTTCDLCGTQESDSYGSIANIGMVCHRCSLLSMGGAEMALMPHCPKVPDDIDPEVLSIQQKGMEPLTPDEYDSWVKSSGNNVKGKEKVREIFAEKKIEEWFEEQGGSVLTELSPDPITFELFRGCAVKHPPCSPEYSIPGISEEVAEAMINMFRLLIFVLPHQPDIGELVDGVFVANMCENCGKQGGSMKRCARCKKMKYCSKNCQRAHWKTHKQDCVPPS